MQMEAQAALELTTFFPEAIRLAKEAERRGNLPIGALIVLDGEIIGRGSNAIYQPEVGLTRHAEMEALRAVSPTLWDRSAEMTLLTTLEPCLMCAGAILLHRIGRLLYGSRDPIGGATISLETLPPYFQERLASIQWIGPAFAEGCDPLFARVQELERRRGISALFAAAEG